ncbi:MAG TPA: 6-carboxytetrahydropterin synthase [Bryobacteraceae bacterium]|nr:6-carboxytetrahydropterin synthase [Bryobacteraceae bacterium]
MIRVTRRYRFSASHRLHAAGLTEEQNRELYGKCNNPYGHGHDYEIEISARGAIDGRSGRILDTRVLDALVEQQVLRPLDHRNLNEDVEPFRNVVPTSENLAREIFKRLSDRWKTAFPGEWPILEKIRIAETPRNIFEIAEPHE